MIEGKTSCGFDFKINENVLDNMELIDALVEGADNSPLAISSISRLLLGDKQRKDLYNFLRAKDGRVPVETVSTAISDMFAFMGDKSKK